MKTRIEFKKRSKPFPHDYSVPMRRLASYLVSKAQKRIAAGIAPANSQLTQDVKGNNLPLRDTGRYMAGIAAASGTNWAQAGTKDPRARMLQEGGEIKPKRARSLAIPAGARTRQMMRRYGQTPRACIDAMKADGYQVWSTKLSKVIWARKGKTGKPFALFLLRKSVKIPARPHLYIDEADEREAIAMIERHLGFAK